MLRRRLLIEWFVIAVITITVVAALALTRSTARIDNAYYDLVVGLRSPPPSDSIVIVAIDDASVASLGRWPWPRTVHAAAVSRIAAARPAALAYDILFTESTASPSDDAVLGTAFRNVPTVLPALTEVPGRDGRSVEMVPPVPAVTAGARAAGHVVLPHEDDGVGRVGLLRLHDGEREWLHVMEEAYRLAFGHASRAAARGEVTVRIPFQPVSGGFRTVSFGAVARGELPHQFLAGKIVLVGATAGGLGDRHRVPVRDGGTLAGVEVQANLLNALIADRLVRDTPPAAALVALILPSLLLLAGFWLLRPTQALTASLGTIGVMFVAPGVLLVYGGWWLPPTPALTGLLIAYPLWGWRRLQAVDAAIAAELKIFGTEAPAAERSPRRLLSDPIGWQTAHLSASIAQLRDLRQMIADAVEGIADPLIVTNMDERVILTNGPAKRLFGEMPVRESVTDTIILSNEKEITIGNRVFSRRRTPLSSTGGEQRGWILLLAEITAIRQAEHQREVALQFLSHDMRSPQVTTITLLKNEAAANLAPKLIAQVEANARRTLKLADDFVQLARLGHRPFVPEEIDLCDAICEAMDALWAQATAKQIRIAVSGMDEPCCVMGERDELTRMFVNLLGNAIRFTPEGQTVRCTLEVVDDGRWVITRVEDEGPGIDPQHASSLFERFSTSASGQQGAGLGLAYVRAAAERHGGSVDYFGLTPHGACFVVRLPMIASDAST